MLLDWEPVAPPAVAGVAEPDDDWLPELESRPAGEGADGVDAVLPAPELELELELELDDDDGVLLALGEDCDGVLGEEGEDDEEDEGVVGIELWEDC